MILAAQLEKIESSGLIRVAQDDPELEYIFRHALVQDATYESLLKADRRTLHQAVGRTLENLYVGRLDEIAATLGFHFEKAEDFDKAVSYYIRAGEAAARIYALNEAMDLFRRARDLIPPSFPREKLIHLYSQYGRVLELAGRFDRVIDLYEQMRVEGIRREDLQMQLDALMSRAILHATPSPHHSFAISTELCERALTIAITLNELEAQSRIYWILMLAMTFEGHLEEAVSYGEQALEIARKVDKPEQLAFILNDITRCYNTSGMRAKGSAANLEARALWKKLDNLPMLTDNLGTCAQYLFFAGEYRQAITVAHEAYEIAKSIHNIWAQTFCLMILGFCYGELGEIEQALETNQELLSFDPAQTFAIAQVAIRAHLASIYSGFGDIDTGYRYAQAAVEQAMGLDFNIVPPALSGLVYYKLLEEDLAEAESLFAKATEHYNPENFTTFTPQYVENARHTLLMYKGEFSAALDAVDKIISILNRLEIVFCRPDFLFRKANTLVALGRYDDALMILQETASLCERIENGNILWKVYALMGDLHNQLGHLSEAQQAQQKAREAIHFLLDHLPVDLRQSFLQLPEVMKLVEKI
jgi:tetratricopeptide (TPR) repeat protein